MWSADLSHRHVIIHSCCCLRRALERWSSSFGPAASVPGVQPNDVVDPEKPVPSDDGLAPRQCHGIGALCEKDFSFHRQRDGEMKQLFGSPKRRGDVAAQQETLVAYWLADINTNVLRRSGDFQDLSPIENACMA